MCRGHGLRLTRRRCDMLYLPVLCVCLVARRGMTIKPQLPNTSSCKGTTLAKASSNWADNSCVWCRLTSTWLLLTWPTSLIGSWRCPLSARCVWGVSGCSMATGCARATLSSCEAVVPYPNMSYLFVSYPTFRAAPCVFVSSAAS